MNRQGEMTQNETKIFLSDFVVRDECLFDRMFLTRFAKLIMGHFSSSQIGQARDGFSLEAICAVSNQIKYQM